MKRLNLVGNKYGRLTVIALDHTDKTCTFWRCLCECGNEHVVRGYHLKSGRVRSCGCLSRDARLKLGAKSGAERANYWHGGFGTKLYGVWAAMIRRCENPNQKYYPDYGGRGITVCEEWRKDFVVFRDWANSNGYKEGLTIDRIDVNGNYEPSNCRWVTMKVQAQNRRNTIKIFHDGRYYTLREIAEFGNLKVRTVIGRYERGEREFLKLIRKVK